MKIMSKHNERILIKFIIVRAAEIDFFILSFAYVFAFMRTCHPARGLACLYLCECMQVWVFVAI